MNSIKMNQQAIEAILNGSKTMTRRPIKDAIDSAKYKIGETVVIENGYGTCVLCDKEWSNCCCQDKQPEIIFTNIKVERLHDISEEDCIKEGVRHPFVDAGGYVEEDCMQQAFKIEFWNNLPYKVPYDWNSNPYVFVYEFEMVV